MAFLCDSGYGDELVDDVSQARLLVQLKTHHVEGAMDVKFVEFKTLPWLVEEDSWKAPDHPQGVLPQNWGKIEQIRTVTCMVLKAKANDRRKNLALHYNEFREL
ncbi:hypothetical protein TNCV_27951 [Trichonephila clavipes]|uniref:Uncharacterized protein n=1 Tax=Trichonephila clavipes TaxID=2585209 RepID=A0A8X6WKH1_TRICX|nr:hypothetical protein TNCV_27951 [Trichonephila clavipes]